MSAGGTGFQTCSKQGGSKSSGVCELVLHLVLDTVVMKAGFGWKGSWHMWLVSAERRTRLKLTSKRSEQLQSRRCTSAQEIRQSISGQASTGASGGRWVQEQHIKIIKCYQMCVCSISSVRVKILSGPAWAHSRVSVLFIWTSLATRSGRPSLLIAQATPCSQGSNGQHFYVNIPLLILACCISLSLCLRALSALLHP